MLEEYAPSFELAVGAALILYSGIHYKMYSLHPWICTYEV